MSLTYVGIIGLLLSLVLPVEEASKVAEAIVVVVSTGIALYGRYRLGGITALGARKK